MLVVIASSLLSIANYNIGCSLCPLLSGQLNLEYWVLWGEGKPDDYRKGVRARTRPNNKFNPHVMPSPGIKSRPWPWEASPLTTILSLLPATLQTEK